MRKNKGDRKNLTFVDKIRGVKVVYKITGLNLDNLINTLKNRGITLFDIKKLNNKQVIVAVSYNNSKKLFAIAKEMCYSVKKIREKGLGLILLNSVRSVGAILGALVFSLITIGLSDIIFEVNYSGTGSACKGQVQEYLSSVGVNKYSRFSSFDIQNLEDQILANCNDLSFVSLQKKGNRLMVNLTLSTMGEKRLDDSIYQFHSTVSGVVESLKVYRGTAVVKEGDKINKGDLLVDGYMVIKEQTVKINVLASASILVEQTFYYTLDGDNQEEIAILFAKENIEDKEVVDLSVNKIQTNNQFIYGVTVKYRAVIYAG